MHACIEIIKTKSLYPQNQLLKKGIIEKYGRVYSTILTKKEIKTANDIGNVS
jgi:hypothetical protein